MGKAGSSQNSRGLWAKSMTTDDTGDIPLGGQVVELGSVPCEREGGSRRRTVAGSQMRTNH